MNPVHLSTTKKPLVNSFHRLIAKGIFTYTLHRVILQVDSFPRVTYISILMLPWHNSLTSTRVRYGEQYHLLFKFFQIVICAKRMKYSNQCFMICSTEQGWQCVTVTTVLNCVLCPPRHSGYLPNQCQCQQVCVYINHFDTCAQLQCNDYIILWWNS